MNKKLYEYYEGVVTKAVQDLRNTCITAICVMVSDGVFNGPDGKPSPIFLPRGNEHLNLVKFAFDGEKRVDASKTMFSITTYDMDEDEVANKENYTLETLPTVWLYEVYRYVSRSF